jgi:hypothetical protein
MLTGGGDNTIKVDLKARLKFVVNCKDRSTWYGAFRVAKLTGLGTSGKEVVEHIEGSQKVMKEGKLARQIACACCSLVRKGK